MIASSLRVLVVEDDADDYMIIERLFAGIKDRNFKVERAEDYESGAAALARHAHDVYIFDYRLGSSDGIELIHEARLLKCDAPIIMVTGDYDPAVGQAALVAGATDFVPKGELTSDVISRLVRYALVRVAAQSEIRQRSVEDELTQCFNRTHLLGLLKAEMTRSVRYERGMAVLLVDVDNFTELNERHGPVLGDRVLSSVAQTCRYILRLSDIVGRYGSDEFCVLLPQTHLRGACGLAERIREAVNKLRLEVADEPLKVSVSVGAVALADLNGVQTTQLLERVEAALQQAKDAGGDQVQGVEI